MTEEFENPPVEPTVEPAVESDQARGKLERELDDMMNQLKRVSADYQNYQKRVAREIEEDRRYANSAFAKEVLGIVDDLERALAAGTQNADAKVLLDGVRITHEHLMALLARHGVQPIDAQGKPFDPALHEAMMQRPTDDAPPMTVLQELARGYTIHGRTLRPAKVIVSSAKAQG